MLEESGLEFRTLPEPRARTVHPPRRPEDPARVAPLLARPRRRRPEHGRLTGSLETSLSGEIPYLARTLKRYKAVSF
jgi:hypothetical protein